MAIQWVNSFEDLYSNSGFGSNFVLDRLIGWSNVGTGDTTNFIQNSDNTANKNTQFPMPGNKGLSAFLTTTGNNFANFTTIQRPVVDNNKLVLCGGFRTQFPAYLKSTAIMSFGGANKLSFGLNGKFAALYVNDTLAATSAVDIVSGSPWSFITLFQDKVANKLYLRINGQVAADVDLPAGHTTNAAILDLGRDVGGYQSNFSEVMVYDSVDPMGPLLVGEYFKTTNVVNQFTGSTNIVNNRPFSDASFVNSETSGAEDRFSYTNILPTGMELGSIKAVIQKAVAASGGVTGGSLNLRMRIGASTTNYDTSVSSSLVSTTPVLVQKVWETNPATSAAWTRSEVQSVQTGYVVAA